MGYRWAETFDKAVTLFARELHVPRKEIENILADGKQTIFQRVGARELLFIPDKTGYICAVEY